MKQFVTTAFCAIMMAMCTTAVQAQKSSEKQRMTPEQFTESRARHIAKELKLDEATTKQFVATFSEQQKEMKALQPKCKHCAKGEAKNKKCCDEKQKLSDAEMDKVFNERIDHQKKMLELRAKYYGKYRKFLTAKQAERVFKFEQKGMKHLGKKGHAPGHQHGKGMKGRRPAPKDEAQK